jgi:type IV secretory pathway VirB2 component (pilin)
MVRYRSASVVLCVAVAVLASITSSTLASPNSLPMQNPQTVNIGVIGPFDGPTAQGVSLAVERISASGPISGPGGTTYTLTIVPADAKTPDAIGSAVARLKDSNVVTRFGFS